MAEHSAGPRTLEACSPGAAHCHAFIMMMQFEQDPYAHIAVFPNEATASIAAMALMIEPAMAGVVGFDMRIDLN